MGTKVFILDTNVLVYNPHCIETLGDNIIVMPISAIEELDDLKNDTRPHKQQMAHDAREASRQLDEYRKLGSLVGGVPTKSGGILIVTCNDSDFSLLPIGLEQSVDNRILLIAKAWQDSMPKRPQQGSAQEVNDLPELLPFSEVCLITKDTNLRIKANACGIPAEDYLHDKLVGNLDELYTGIREDVLPEDMWPQFDGKSAIWTNHRIPAELILSKIDTEPFHNQCCQLVVCDTTYSTIYKKGGGYFNIVNKQSITNGELMPRNPEQWLAYTLAMDQEISLLTLGGKAGSGKTLMALLAGWNQVKAGMYEKMIVYRPTSPLGADLGFLPGDIEEKFQPWTQPIIDNMELILKKDKDFRDKGELRHSKPVKEIMLNGDLEITPMTYATGRSLHGIYMVVDEAQNLTPHQAGIIVTRAGKGTKVVFTGDHMQITNDRVDPISNGHVYATETMKDLYLFGHITLIKSERSDLAEIAASRMLI